MILYVVLPESIGAIDTDRSLLSEREKQAREDRETALGELSSLIDAGYEAIRVDTKGSDHGVYKVFSMERIADQTQIDPQTQTAAHANAHAGT